MIKINEIFFSIQGESSRTGYPTVFIRTSGCHLRCSYCDTKYAYHDGSPLAVAEILLKVASFSPKYVCLTGGEPLLQKESHELMCLLCDNGYEVSIETSGDLDCRQIDSRVLKVIDVKTPDSGEPDAFFLPNLELSGVNTEFKFVICSERDFFWSEEFARKHNLFERGVVLYSPAFEQVEEKWLANKILLEKSSARFQLQIHKYIWAPDQRGV